MSRVGRAGLLAAFAVTAGTGPPAVAAVSDAALVTTAGATPSLVVVAQDGTARTVVAGDPLDAPTAVTAGAGAVAFVADRGGLWRIDLVSGAAVPAVGPGALDDPRAVVTAADGSLVVADSRSHGAGSGAIVRVDPATGATSVITAGAPLHEPVGLAIEPSGSLLVADRTGGGENGVGGLYRVTPSGDVSLLARGTELRGIRGVASTSSGAFVSLATTDGPTLVLVDPVSGDVHQLTGAPTVTDPVGPVATPGDGALLVDRAAATLIAFSALRPPDWSVVAGAPWLLAATAVGAPGAPAQPVPPPSTPPTVTLPGITKPGSIVMGPVSLTPNTFRPLKRGGIVAVVSGAKMVFTLSAPTRVRLTIHVCRSRGARPRGLACRRFQRLAGKAYVSGIAGRNALTFTGRLNGHRLPAGIYKVYAKAEQPDGLWADARTARFRILP